MINWEQCSISFVKQGFWCKMHFALRHSIPELSCWWMTIYHSFIFGCCRFQSCPPKHTNNFLLLFLLLVYFCSISLGGDEHFNGRCCIKNFKHWRDDYHNSRIWSLNQFTFFNDRYCAKTLKLKGWLPPF